MSVKYDLYKNSENTKFEKRLIPYGLPNRSGEKQIPEYIVIHEVSLGLGESPENYNMDHYARKIEQDGLNGSTIGYHILVGDKKVYQFLLETEATHHTGTKEGNHNSIGVERIICAGTNHEQALFNQAKVIATLMIKWNIPLNKVVTHKGMQQMYKPSSINYELSIKNFNEINNLDVTSSDYIEEYNIIDELYSKILETNSPKLQEKNIANQLNILENKDYLLNIKNITNTFDELSKERKIYELFQIVELETKLKKILYNLKEMKYEPLNKKIGGIEFEEVIQPKNCPNRLLLGQRGGLEKFYRQIMHCINNKCFFEELLFDKLEPEIEKSNSK